MSGIFFHPSALGRLRHLCNSVTNPFNSDVCEGFVLPGKRRFASVLAEGRGADRIGISWAQARDQFGYFGQGLFFDLSIFKCIGDEDISFRDRKFQFPDQAGKGSSLSTGSGKYLRGYFV